MASSGNKHYVRLLLHWRWMILAIAIPLSMVIEILEGDTHDLHFLDEVIIDGLILPMATWLVLTFVAQRMKLQFAQEEQLQQRQRFMHDLADHRDYSALTQWLVRFFGRELGAADVTLFMYDEEQRRLTRAAEWQAPQQEAVRDAPRGVARAYSYVILQQNRQVGVLHLRTQPGILLTPEQQELLAALMPEIGRALSQALEDVAATQRMYREAQIYERRRIAHELHDTLAQQVFYLHLGLDQFTEDRRLSNDPTVREKLALMRDVAAEVYDQIRHNLSILRTWEQVDLTEAISELVRLTAYNANLTVDVQIEGEPEWLSPHTSERVYGIVREALHNVVKHAQARHIDLRLVWLADALRLMLRDDGVGFEPAQPLADGHYGLGLMRETVEALQGEWSLASKPGSGTCLEIRIPFQRTGGVLSDTQPHGIALPPEFAPAD